jgi:hypothetical protein
MASRIAVLLSVGCSGIRNSIVVFIPAFAIFPIFTPSNFPIHANRN